MFEKLKGVEERFEEIEKLLSDPNIVNDRQLFQKYSREHSDLGKIVVAFRAYNQVDEDLEGSRELLSDADPDIKALAGEDIDRLEHEKTELESELECDS